MRRFPRSPQSAPHAPVAYSPQQNVIPRRLSRTSPRQKLAYRRQAEDPLSVNGFRHSEPEATPDEEVHLLPVEGPRGLEFESDLEFFGMDLVEKFILSDLEGVQSRRRISEAQLEILQNERRWFDLIVNQVILNVRVSGFLNLYGLREQEVEKLTFSNWESIRGYVDANSLLDEMLLRETQTHADLLWNRLRGEEQWEFAHSVGRAENGGEMRIIVEGFLSKWGVRRVYVQGAASRKWKHVWI